MPKKHIQKPRNTDTPEDATMMIASMIEIAPVFNLLVAQALFHHGDGSLRGTFERSVSKFSTQSRAALRIKLLWCIVGQQLIKFFRLIKDRIKVYFTNYSNFTSDNYVRCVRERCTGFFSCGRDEKHINFWNLNSDSRTSRFIINQVLLLLRSLVLLQEHFRSYVSLKDKRKHQSVAQKTQHSHVKAYTS